MKSFINFLKTNKQNLEMLLEGAEPDLESPYIEMIVKELLKDEDHPNASIS